MEFGHSKPTKTDQNELADKTEFYPVILSIKVVVSCKAQLHN